MAETLRRVVIWPGSIGRAAIGSKWQTIARELQRQTGATFALLCKLPQDRAAYQTEWGALASHVQDVEMTYREAMVQPMPDEPAAIEAQARRYEETYGTSMIELLQSDRHLGLAYAAGGLNLHASRLMRETTYHRSLWLAMRMLDFFDRYLAEQRADLVLMEGVASLHTKALVVVARARGIPVRIPLSRYQNLVYWVGNEFYEMPWLTACHTQTPLPDASGAVAVAGPYAKSVLLRRGIQDELRLWGTLKACAWEIAQRAYQNIIGYRKFAGYSLASKLAYRLRAYRRHTFWERHSFTDAAELRGTRYVLYLLQQEPESSLAVRAPEFNHQAAIIDLLAKNVPADVRVVVKEHEANNVAARPDGFYEWLARVPNIRMASMHMNSIPLVEGSMAVATVTGTVGMEAALMGIPVLTFGRHNLFDIIPHVRPIDRLSDLRPALMRIYDEGETGRDQRRREGRRFFAALTACSVDMAEERFHAAGGTLSEGRARALVELLRSTLRASEQAGRAELAEAR